MRIYWGLGSLPDLEGLSKDARRRIWRRCCPRVMTRGWTPAALLLCGALAVVGESLGSGPGLHVFSALLGAGIGGAIAGEVSLHEARPHIRRELETDGGDSG